MGKARTDPTHRREQSEGKQTNCLYSVKQRIFTYCRWRLCSPHIIAGQFERLSVSHVKPVRAGGGWTHRGIPPRNTDFLPLNDGFGNLTLTLPFARVRENAHCLKWCIEKLCPYLSSVLRHATHRRTPRSYINHAKRSLEMYLYDDCNSKRKCIHCRSYKLQLYTDT